MPAWCAGMGDVSERAWSGHLGHRAPDKQPVIDPDLHEAVFQQRNEDTLNERAGAGLNGAQHGFSLIKKRVGPRLSILCR